MFVRMIRGQVADAASADAALDRWDAEMHPGEGGFVGSTAGLTTDGQLVLVARYEGEAAAPPDGPWAELRGVLEAPVVEEATGEVDEAMGGGSDDAGFVQVFWGSGDREAARSAMVSAEPVLRRERPEILGGFTLWLGGSRFVDFAYFTSEEEAREGENRELSEEGRAVFEEFGRVLAAEGFADIPNPRLR